jgi:hypothetical protein
MQGSATHRDLSDVGFQKLSSEEHLHRGQQVGWCVAHVGCKHVLCTELELQKARGRARAGVNEGAGDVRANALAGA